MQNVILVIHILACLAMIGLVLLQKSEGGGLGIGGGGGGNSLMSGRGAAGTLVRVTMIFGAIFFITSLTLTSIANRSADNRSGIERALEPATPDEPSQPIDLFDPTVPLFNETPLTTPEPQPESLFDPLPAEPADPAGAESDTGDTPESPQ